MTPISRIVSSPLISSDVSSQLSPDSIFIKWRPLTAAGEVDIGSWSSYSNNHTIIVPGGVLVSWLVSVSSEEIMGFIIEVKGQ